MNYQFIETIQKDGLCRILLNRPEKQNAVHAGMIDELNDILKQLAKNDSVRIVVLEGKGKSFCSGADLMWFAELATYQKKDIRKQFEPLSILLRRLQNLPQVTIALAKGNIFGGGIGLLAACDFVLIEESAILAFSEVLLGLVPATILPFVAGRINKQQARKLMLTGKYFPANIALANGFADEIFPEDKLEEGLQTLLSDLKNAAPEAIQVCKKLINKVYSGKVKPEDYHYTAKILAGRIASEEGKERIGAFLEKRK